MDLDSRVYSRARLARDARFDGKFFIGVLTTGIYCRPICRARTSKESNVRYFPTAAAAAEAGFRPCLRCRPECSPGTPAWAGTQNTVSRALRLISESGLDDGGVEALAERLGVGARHLRRLFLRHLGASPSTVAQTRRLHFAKQLIDETRLPMTEVAIVSGFGCVRRFNGAVRKVYQRTPTQIRRLAGRKAAQPANEYSLHLPFRPPYDWKNFSDFLAARATPGVEVVEPGTYRRSISLNGNQGYIEISLNQGTNALAVRVQIADPRSLFFIVERIRAMFDVNADWSIIVQTLRRDPPLALRVEAYPGLRVPGSWDAFELTTQAILAQSGKATATAVAGRMVRAFGQPFCPAKGLTHLFPTPERLAECDLSAIGVVGKRADAIRAFARAVRDGEISFERVVDSQTFTDQLCKIQGVAKSTAQYVAMRALREPDVLPTGDLDLVRALALRNSRELERRSRAWRPWRAYAAMYLWSIGAACKTRK